MQSDTMMKVKLSNPIKNKYGDPLHIGDGIIEVDETDKAINMLIREGAIDPVYETVKEEIKNEFITIKPKIEVVEVLKQKIHVYTKTELKKMNKQQQTEILQRYGFIKVPSLEIERVELIMNVQKKG